MGSRGVVPSAGLEVTVTGLTVTRMVSFSPTGVLQNTKINVKTSLIAKFATMNWTSIWSAANLLMGY